MIQLKKLIYIVIVILLCSCENIKPTFIYDSDSKEGAYLYTLWKDTSNNVCLVTRGEDLGGMGSVSWLSLEKRIGNDTISYQLGSLLSYNYKLAKVFRDTLYLYKDSGNDPHIGWHQAHKKGITSLSYFKKEPLDTLKTKHLYGQIYRWDQGKLTKFKSNTIAFEDLYTQEGIYYIPPPGIVIKFKYTLKEIVKQLSNIESKNDAPRSLH